jgi:hypothetical protein
MRYGAVHPPFIDGTQARPQPSLVSTEFLMIFVQVASKISVSKVHAGGASGKTT